MTAMSTVLDSEEIDCVLDDGRRFAASLVGIDPRREMALLKLEAEGLPFAPLDGGSLEEGLARAEGGEAADGGPEGSRTVGASTGRGQRPAAQAPASTPSRISLAWPLAMSG